MNNHAAKILVVEDEKHMREVLSILLEGEGYIVETAKDGMEAIEWLEKDIYDIVITDVKMPGADGFEILRKSKEISPETLVIMITAFGTVESAIDAMKEGACDFIHKPFKIDEIRLIVKNALQRRMLSTEVSLLRETVKTTFEVENIIGRSPKMQEVLVMIKKTAGTDLNVLVTGESGTGKELVAAALHNLSPRRDKGFVAINCASFPEGLLESELFGHMKGAFTGAIQNKKGLFEMADNGTLFLDEIVEMPINLQSKLLRAIEVGTFRRVGGTSDIIVNARIIAATNRDLKDAVDNGTFREDLYFRLNVIPIHLPPLRERKEDILPLIEHFMKKYSDSRRQISGKAMKLLMDYEWKGNIRELENAIERVLLFADTEIITDSDLPSEIQGYSEKAVTIDVEQGVNLERILAEQEKSYLREAMKITGGNKTEASKLLGLSFRSFRHKLTKYGM